MILSSFCRNMGLLPFVLIISKNWPPIAKVSSKSIKNWPRYRFSKIVSNFLSKILSILCSFCVHFLVQKFVHFLSNLDLGGPFGPWPGGSPQTLTWAPPQTLARNLTWEVPWTLTWTLTWGPPVNRQTENITFALRAVTSYGMHNVRLIGSCICI